MSMRVSSLGSLASRKSSSERRSNPRQDQPFQPEAGASPFPGYRLERLRGRGGFATVWEAIDPNGSRLALKFMSSQNSSSTAREIRSIQTIQRLSHPRLLKIRQVWSMPGQIVIGMDLADASLLDLFMLYADEFGRPIESEKVCMYLFQAAEALDFLNARRHTLDGGLIAFQHGDIKPNNILLTGDEAKLADYGLGTPMIGPSTPCSRQGTLEYAAPEIFSGTLTETSDQFSLAVTYYLLRSGNFPFPAPPAIVPRNYSRPAPDLSLVEKSEQSILARALSPVPQDRFASCGEMMCQLLKSLDYEIVRDAARGMSIRPTPDSITRSKLLKAVNDAKQSRT
jgi:serine/threonine protein kinase, bacterial